MGNFCWEMFPLRDTFPFPSKRPIFPRNEGFEKKECLWLEGKFMTCPREGKFTPSHFLPQKMLWAILCCSVLYYAEKARNSPKKQGFPLCRTLKSLEERERAKTHKNNKENRRTTQSEENEKSKVWRVRAQPLKPQRIKIEQSRVLDPLESKCQGRGQCGKVGG